MIEVLLVEDDPVLGEGLATSLRLENYSVRWVQTLKAAVEANKKKDLNLIILDLNFPHGNGLDFLTLLRKEGSRIPVIILTAKSDEQDIVQGLQAGANDYVKKPFGQMELLARMKTALRETQCREPQVRYGDLLIILGKRKAMYRDTEIELNRREYDVLRYFVQNAEAVVTRDSLIEALDQDSDIFDRTIDSHVSHVRARLREAGVKSIKISSLYGVGYRMESV